MLRDALPTTDVSDKHPGWIAALELMLGSAALFLVEGLRSLG